MRESPEVSPPRFCSIDGMTLMNATFVTSQGGFDPFTGMKVPEEVHLQLNCPKENHDIWRLYSGQWIKVRP